MLQTKQINTKTLHRNKYLPIYYTCGKSFLTRTTSWEIVLDKNDFGSRSCQERLLKSFLWRTTSEVVLVENDFHYIFFLKFALSYTPAFSPPTRENIFFCFDMSTPLLSCQITQSPACACVCDEWSSSGFSHSREVTVQIHSSYINNRSLPPLIPHKHFALFLLTIEDTLFLKHFSTHSSAWVASSSSLNFLLIRVCKFSTHTQRVSSYTIFKFLCFHICSCEVVSFLWFCLLPYTHILILFH